MRKSWKRRCIRSRCNAKGTRAAPISAGRGIESTQGIKQARSQRRSGIALAIIGVQHAVIGAQRPLHRHKPAEPSPSPTCLGGVPTSYHLSTCSSKRYVGRPAQRPLHRQSHDPLRGYPGLLAHTSLRSFCRWLKRFRHVGRPIPKEQVSFSFSRLLGRARSTASPVPRRSERQAS